MGPIACLIAAACALGASPSAGGTFTIDGTSRLDALSASLPATGTHRVRFSGEGYRAPGSLALANNGSDSLVFERMSPYDTATLRIQGSLLRIQGQRGTVVLRGLALKLEPGAALFDTSLGGNHALVLDGCTLLGNAAAAAKALAWSGDGKVSLVNCLFTNLGATAITSTNSISIVNSMFVSTGPITLTETQTDGGVSLFNNLFNFSGVLMVNIGGRLEMWFNTTNRTQFHLDGKTTASFSIHNNYFANPPVRNHVVEAGTARFAVAIKPGSYRTANSIAVENVRYPAWDGFENPNAVPLFGPGNATIPAARDSAVAWDWRIPGDTSHGAWNGNLPLPAFNLFPSDTSLELPLPGGSATVTPSPFPRRLRFFLKTVPFPYSAYLPDSVRPWFRNDTVVALEGNAAVVGLSLPQRDAGVPLLFARGDAGYLAGPPGPRGGALYRNGRAEAREFLPALGGQNTFRGKDAVVPHPQLPGLSLVFSSVTRAGMTNFGPLLLRPENRRWRVPLFQGREIAFTATTTAEGEGTLRMGIMAAGTAVSRKDSLYYWLGGDRFLRAKDSAGGYWAAVPFPAGRLEAMLVESLPVDEWGPAQPAAAAAPMLRGESLVFAPALTPAERSALPWFRADLLSIGLSGALRMESSRYAPVESSLSVGLEPDRFYAYRVVYRSPLDRFSPDLKWTPLTGRQPSPAAIEARLPVRKAMFRHLIGFPFDGATVGANVLAGMEGGAGELLALDTLDGGTWAGVTPARETRLQRGKGYLLAAGRPFRPKAQGAAFYGLKPDTLRFDRPGWHLIANPLPYPFPRSALEIPDSTALSFPRALRRMDTAAGSPAAYDWPVPDTLQPFEGYLLYVFKPTALGFNPYSAAVRDGLVAASGAPSSAVSAAETAAMPAAPKASSAAPEPDALRVTLSGPGGSRSAVFYRSGPFLPTPYMRPLSGGGRTLEFRAGEGAGWSFRKVDRTDSLRIPVEIIAPEAGNYALGVSGGRTDGKAPGESGALLDLGSGRVYRAGEMGAMSLAAGPHAFVLLLGKAAAPGIAGFSAGLPDAFALDQNSPNPFRGRTRIRFRVPGGRGGPFRGRFQVTAVDGRAIEARDLGPLAVGEHALTVDERGWRPGVYLYELRLESGQGVRTLRRKMVCGLPAR